jgi:hypothetical protein
MPAEVKTIGASGQISLGKENAGRTVTVEKVEEGVWVIKAGQFIPDNERWLHTPEMKRKLDKAMVWAKTHPPRETDLDELEQRFKMRHAAAKKAATPSQSKRKPR